MANILQKENKILRKKTEEVPLKKIGSSEVKKTLEKMRNALEGQIDGVAIAAPQIGVLKRIFIVSRRAAEVDQKMKTGETNPAISNNSMAYTEFLHNNGDSNLKNISTKTLQATRPSPSFYASSFAKAMADKKASEDKTGYGGQASYKLQAKDLPPLVYINPVIVKRSKEKRWMEEGCLSARWLYGRVLRSTRVTVRAYDEKGKQFIRGASGILAQIFQHETDHLDGALFVDKAKDMQEIPPEKWGKRNELLH